MLCSTTPQAADRLVECRLMGETIEAVHFIADCLWSREGAIGQQSWAGYHIIDIDALNAQRLEPPQAIAGRKLITRVRSSLATEPFLRYR